MNGKPSQREIDLNAQFWHKSAIDNLKTASSLLKSKRYNFCMFMCQQTIEAILKCAFVQLKNDRPPFLHKLSRIQVMTGLSIPDWVDETILMADAHYIKSRYFEDRFDRHIYNHKNASSLLNKTKKVLEWFLKELKLEK